MTYSKQEFYGGSFHKEFNSGDLEHTIGYGDYTRVLYFTEDSVLTTVTVNLPEIAKVRQFGFMYYFLANVTSAELEIRDFTGSLQVSLDPGECAAIGMRTRATGITDWVIDTADCVHEPPPEPGPPTVSFGGAFLDHDTWLYQHVDNTWTQGTNTPVDSHFAQAVSTVHVSTGLIRSFWKHLTVHYEYSFGTDSHTNKTTAPTANEQTGSARLRDGDGVSDEMYLSWGALSTENTPTLYNPATDVWTFAAALTGTPAGGQLVQFGKCVTSAGAIGITSSWWAFMIIADPEIDPDTGEWPYFWAYRGVTDTHHELPMVAATPVPPNRWQASMINLGPAVHVVGGSVVALTPNIPQDASARHLRYSGSLGGFWVSRPQLPDPVMGMGVEIISDVPNKFTLGMGEHADDVTGSANHWEYDETSQSYIARAVASWASKNSQEGSWCIAGA